jgi:DNA-binding NarL/FixJ family response regulator
VTSVNSLLRADLIDFSDRYGLTRREGDLVYLLATGSSTDQAIADKLCVSHNTIHNHFKNVFRKTGTNGKTELLALFIKDLMMRQASYRPFLRRPRVLIVDEDGKEYNEVTRIMEERGILVFQEKRADEVVRRIDDLNVDVVVADITMPDKSGFSALTAVRKRFPYNPLVFLVTAIKGISREDCLAWGANELFEKPVKNEDLIFAVISSFVDSPYEKNRLVRVDSHLSARIEDIFDVSVDNIGFGGAFIPLSIDQLGHKRLFYPGNTISLQLFFEDGTQLSFKGEIIWRKEPSRSSIIAGVGIRFVELTNVQKKAIEGYVKRCHLLGFVPWDRSRRSAFPPAIAE